MRNSSQLFTYPSYGVPRVTSSQFSLASIWAWTNLPQLLASSMYSSTVIPRTYSHHSNRSRASPSKGKANDTMSLTLGRLGS